MRKCPRCGGEGHRSQSRGFIEKRILKTLRVRPYRCTLCNKRFYRYSHGDHSKHRRLPLRASGLGNEKQPDALPKLVAQIREAEMRLEPANPQPGQDGGEPSQN